MPLLKKLFAALSIILLSVMLTSCIAAIVAGGAAGGYAIYDRRSLTRLEQDARIFHVIHKAIVTDQQFRGSRINVSSFNRVVLLTGQTPNTSLRQLAEQIAQRTPQVTRVHNEIVVGAPVSISYQSKDTWITSKIRSQLLAQKGLDSGAIHTVTENGTVYLMGVVTPEDGRLAADVARHVQGVVKVVKVFQYIR